MTRARDVENWSSSIQEVKKDGASEKVACCLLHSLSRSAEYLATLL